MLIVTCAIIIHQNRILITQRDSGSDHPFQWEFPGGKINPGETNEECIIREIREELEIKIEILEPMVAISHDYGLKQIKLIPFLCAIKSGKIKLVEHYDFEWVMFEELKNYDFAAADKKIFRNRRNQTILKKYLRKNMDNTR